MGILAAVLLTVWLLGIVGLVAVVATVMKDPDNQDEAVLGMRDAMEINPTLVVLVLTLVILVWPASLLYGALKKGIN